MATSGSTNWVLTRDDIITEALENIGVLAAGETAAADDVTSASRTLNILAKSLHADPGVRLRFIDQQTVSLVDGTGSYDLAADTLKVLDVWLRINNEDTHLDVISREEYDLEVAKTAEGQPQRVYIDYAPDTPKAYFLPVPEASYTAYVVNERMVEDFDASADNPDYPVKATDMLVTGLTWKLAPKFGLPLDERMYWQQLFEKARREYRAGDTNRNGRETVAPSNVV